MVRLAGFEPTTSASAGLRSIQLSYKRHFFLTASGKLGGNVLLLLLYAALVPKERFELSCPFGHYALNVARLPFRHFGMPGDIHTLPLRRSGLVL